jgi:hypothetical protein
VVDDLVGRHEVEATGLHRGTQQVSLDVVQVLRRAELALGGDDALAEVEPDDGGVGQAREACRVAADAGAGLEHEALAGEEVAQAVLVAEPEALHVPGVLGIEALPYLVAVDLRPLRRERVERPRLVAQRA